MRLVAGLLSLALSSSLAFAGDTPAPNESPPPVPTSSGLRVVKVLPESHQALLFDRTINKHVLVEAGQQVGSYTVEEIASDEVTLFDQAGGELVLAAPEPRRAKKTSPAEPTPADPYVTNDAGAAPALGGEIDEVGFELPAKTAAPADPYAPAPIVDAMPPRVVSAPATNIEAPAPSRVPEFAETEPVAAITPTVLSRTELNVALADFGKLSSMMSGGFTPQGVRIDRVAETSIFAKAGVRAGDTIVAVDNIKLLSLDDAAELYARATATKATNISLLRAGKLLTLRVLIH